MLLENAKNKQNDELVWRDLPRYGRKFLLSAAVISLLIHIFSILSSFGSLSLSDSKNDESSKVVKIHLSPIKSADELLGKKILETPMAETKPPKTAEFMGAQDHATDRETKLAKKHITDDKNLDAGVKGKQMVEEASKSIPTPRQMISGPGTLAIPGSVSKPRNNYERLLPNKEVDAFGSPTAGHAEYVDADIPEGDRIDMNTTSFKYISYFTSLRKSIEMVWIYPRPAIERGLQGEVQLELVIEKDGKVSRVRVLNSSGYSILDDNMLKTIKLASPFAPLPKGWKKERILVTGAFHYILSYGAH